MGLLISIAGAVLAAGVALFCVGAAHALRGLYDHVWQAPCVALRLAGCVVLTVVKFVARGREPRFPEWTLEAEITQAILRCISTHYPHRIVRPANAAHLRRALEESVKQSSAEVAAEAGVAVQYFSHNGLEHLWIRARPGDETVSATSSSSLSASSSDDRVVVLYFHGGGFVVGCPGTYIALSGYLQRQIRTRLAETLGRDVRVEFLLANYRKAPQFPYPRPPQDAYTMYKYVLEDEKLRPQQIVVMGDSAGGALAMTTLLRARDEHASLLPAAAILSCPFVDREAKRADHESPDCLVTANGVEIFWNVYHDGKGEPSSWGDASPAHCDLRGLPPVYIQAAEFDHILPHSKKLYAKAVADGHSDWTLEIVPNVPHAYTSLRRSGWPTATQSLDNLSAFAAAQLARSAFACDGKLSLTRDPRVAPCS